MGTRMTISTSFFAAPKPSGWRPSLGCPLLPFDDRVVPLDFVLR